MEDKEKIDYKPYTVEQITVALKELYKKPRYNSYDGGFPTTSTTSVTVSSHPRNTVTYTQQGLYNPTGILNNGNIAHQIQDLHMLILEQQNQIQILTKAVEALLETKLETFKKHE